MKRLSLIFTLAVAALTLAGASSQESKPADPAALDAVLKKMDAVAANFTTAQANFQWETYQKVIDEIVDYQTGVIYYRKSNKQIEMMAEVKRAGSSASSMKDEPKFVLLSGGKVRLYQPKTDQVTEFDLGKNQSDFESYIVLGFGASGQDLQKNFDVTYMGPETIEGVKTAKLQLIPKSTKGEEHLQPDFFMDRSGPGGVSTAATVSAAGRLPTGQVFANQAARQNFGRCFQAENDEQDTDRDAERLSC